MSAPVRVRNWDVGLVFMARELVGLPFVWGETDCGTLCRLALDALYDAGVAEAYLGRPWVSPRSALEARDVLRGAHGVLEQLAATPIHRSYASLGDFVVVPGTDDDGLPRLMWVIGLKYLRVSREEGVRAEPLPALDPDAEIWRLP